MLGRAGEAASEQKYGESGHDQLPGEERTWLRAGVRGEPATEERR